MTERFAEHLEREADPADVVGPSECDHGYLPGRCQINSCVHALHPKARKSSLTTLDWYRLNQACEPVWDAFGGTYLVGTAATGDPYRDVDVRTILRDDDFDQLCGDLNVWVLLCTSIAMRLAAATGLPIDYQIQRMTEANEKYPGGNRHPVGMVVTFAGGGDASRFTVDGTSYPYAVGSEVQEP